MKQAFTRCLVLAVLGSAAVTATSVSAAPASRQPIGLGDFFSVKRAADPQISPDGATVAYVAVTPDIASDSYRSSVHVIKVDDGRDTATPIDGPTALMPRWSPDGRALAFIRIGDHAPALMIADVSPNPEGGTPIRMVASLPVVPRELAWSPDGTRLALIAEVPVARRNAVAYLPPAGAAWAPRPLIFDSGGFQTPTAMLPEQAREVALFLVPARGGTLRRVTAESLGPRLPYTGSGLAWSRDGRSVLASLQKEPGAWRNLLQGSLHAIDVETGEALRVAGEPNGSYNKPGVSDDGTVMFACRPPTRENWIRFDICHGPSIKGPFRPVAPDLDRQIGPAKISPDGRGAYGAFIDRGVAKIAWFGFDGKREILAETGGGDADSYANGGALTVARNGTVAFLYSDAATPSEVAIVRRGQQPRVLTRLNADLLGGREINPVEEISYTPTDGSADVHAFLVKPVNHVPGKPAPAIVLIHGGQSSDYGPDFDLIAQVFAAHGYLVIMPNYRGSGSYGREFSNRPGSPVNREHDVIGAADALVARAGADPQRLYVMGGSGGALITGWTIGKSSKFRAAVMWYAPVEWWTYAMEAATGPTSMVGGFERAPWEQPAEYVSRSPYAFAGNVTTPTMLIVGDQDRITPISGSIAYFHALQMRGVASELVVYPGAAHGISDRPSNAMGHIADTLDWLARHGGEPVRKPQLPTPSPAAAPQ